MKTLRFFVGGPAFHPTAQQAAIIAEWLGGDYRYEIRDGGEAFDDLDAVDLLVVMGLHWPGMEKEWAGSLCYRPLEEDRRENLRKYVASGRSLLNFHGGIASYPEWREFGELLGFRWDWKLTSHADIGDYEVKIDAEPHPITEGIGDFHVTDELYVNIQVHPGMDLQVQARMPMQGATFPAIITGRGGRVAGAGKTAYLANGHDLRAFEAPEMRRIWQNTVAWLTSRETL